MAITMTLDDVPLYVLVLMCFIWLPLSNQMTQPLQTRKCLQIVLVMAPVFQTGLLQLQATVKRFLFDLNLVLLCILFLIVFMKVPSEDSNNGIYCIRWLSNAFF